MHRLALVLSTCLPLASCAATGAPTTTIDDAPIERFADMDGARVRYLDHGAGEVALVFVHGWASDVRVWREQHRRFGDVERNLYVDLIGHGGSDEPDLRYSMDDLAASVVAAMDDAGVARGILVGHSNGTPVVRQVYRNHPERVRALVAVDGAFRSMMGDPELAEMMIAPLRGEDYRESVDAMMYSMLSTELYEELLPMALETSQRVMLRTFEAQLDDSVWAPDPIEVPLLAVYAVAFWWTGNYPDFVRSLAPDVDYRVFEGVGHFLQLEDPARFNAALDEFVGRL